MTVLNYIERQKQRVIAKHTGETFLYAKGEEAVELSARSALEILCEINSMKGLNRRERHEALMA